MSTPHMLLPITHRPEGWVWRCTCGDRGPLAPDRDAARRGHIVHKSRNSSGNDYRFDMGGAEAHVDLADALRSTDATVFLSGYHSDLYDDLYGDWDLIEWATHTHSSNAVAVDRGTRVEVLWSNRPIYRSSPDGIEPLFEGLL